MTTYSLYWENNGNQLRITYNFYFNDNSILDIFLYP